MAARDRLPLVSRTLHWLDQTAARSTAALLALAVVALALVAIAWSGFDPTLQADFATACAAITVVMVFVLQHTQRRAQLATQLKLDELIAAMPGADDRIVHLEASTDDEIEVLDEKRTHHHASLRSTDPDER